MDRIKPRWFGRNLQSALRVLPVTVLTGARQTGKTTLTQAIMPARAYFTLDDVGVLDQAERNPDSLLATRPVILDEVQRAPQMLLAVKRAVDTQRRAGDFILTGSANLLLMKHVADSVSGVPTVCAGIAGNVMDCWIVKVAVKLSKALIVTFCGLVLPLSAPLQFANVQLLVGVAVS